MASATIVIVLRRMSYSLDCALIPFRPRFSKGQTARLVLVRARPYELERSSAYAAELVIGGRDSAITASETMPQTNTPAHAATGPKWSSAAVPAHGPTMSAKLNVLEYAPMYSPLRPGGARSATYAVDT